MKNYENIKNELQEVGFDNESAAEFISNIDYIGDRLGRSDIRAASDLNARTMASIGSALKHKHRADKYRRILRAVSAAAAVLLMVVSVSVFNSKTSVSSVLVQEQAPVAAVELSGNPFASPSIIMNTLLDRSASDYSSDITLEAVSELWDGTDSDAGAPTSIRSKRVGAVLA